jgi:hypothetical protein
VAKKRMSVTDLRIESYDSLLILAVISACILVSDTPNWNYWIDSIPARPGKCPNIPPFLREKHISGISIREHSRSRKLSRQEISQPKHVVLSVHVECALPVIPCTATMSMG